MRSESLADAGRRIALLRALFVCLFLLLAARAAHLTVVSERGAFRGKGQLEGVMVLPATRGLIVDRNGVAMALSTQASSVYMLPRDFDGNAKNLDALANALNINPKALRERLRGRKRFTFVRRWVSDEVATRIEALDLPGVGIISEPRRAYPADELASSLLGFANIDGIGVRGIEAQENEWLTGTPVRTPVERDARGRLLARELVAPVSSSGGDVALTIDMAMQAEAETALRDAIKKRGALGGFVVTMDPRTGEILALAESPGFNPNQFRTVDYKKTGSRAFHDALEPGSVMKAFLVAAALDAGAIKRNQRFDTGDGTMQLPGKNIRDHHPYGVIDPSEVLQLSSNIGAVMIAQRLGPEAHYNALLRFGFGRDSGSGFPSESNGLLRGWNDWKPIDHATVSYGQGIGVTAVQLAAAMCALASDGQLRTPRLVSARRRVGGEWEPTAVDEPRRVVKQEVAASVMSMLETVVSADGTGRKAALKGLRVAGKTGTAQKLDVKRRRYSNTRYGAWFMGAAPAEDPKLVIVAMLDEPKGWAHGGGDVAAPLFAKVAAGQLAHLGILTKAEPIPASKRPELLAKTKLSVQKAKPIKLAAVTNKSAEKTSALNKPRTKAKPTATNVSAMKTAVTKLPHVAAPPVGPSSTRASTALSIVENNNEPVLIPDFRGETVQSVRDMARREAISLEIRGEGLAIHQAPTPGTIVYGVNKRVRVSFSTDGGQGG